MQRRTTFCLALVSVLSAVFPQMARAQAAAPEVDPIDEAVNAIRREAAIDGSGEQSIKRWVEARADALAAVPEAACAAAVVAFRDRFEQEYRNPDNSEAYRTQMAQQTAAVAATRFAAQDLRPAVAQALAHALASMAGQVGAVPGMVAGLQSPVPIARYHCAKALAALRGPIAADEATLGRVVAALTEAGKAEASPVVLARIYEALNHPAHVAAVFDSYLAVFDKRLAVRRGEARVCDGAEVHAFEFFRAQGVLAALSDTQKAQLVERLAVFLRLDAERYASPDLDSKNLPSDTDKPRPGSNYRVHNERTRIALVLDAVEEILAAIVRNEAGAIRAQMTEGGHANRQQALQQAYLWVGDPAENVSGALNVAPWNIAIGAP